MMKIKALAIAGMISMLGMAAIAPASAMEVGVTNTTSNTITSGHLSICETDNHWDNGVSVVFQTSGDIQLQGGGAGQKGIGGSVNFGEGGVGLGGSLFGDGLAYAQVSGNGEFATTVTTFRDHNVTNQEFNGQTTTSSVTTSSATFSNF